MKGGEEEGEEREGGRGQGRGWEGGGEEECTCTRYILIQLVCMRNGLERYMYMYMYIQACIVLVPLLQ